MANTAKRRTARDKNHPTSMANAISRARVTGVALVAIFAGLTGWAIAVYGSIVMALVAGIVLTAVAIGMWNTLPILYKPDHRYEPAPVERLHWPEAAPIEPSGRNRRLILCVHGFPSTPDDFRRFIAVSDSRGWDIAAPLLPGCGTEPEDILRTGWGQYLAMVRDTWTSLRPRYESACIAGISMGGALTLALAEETCADPALAPNAIATVGAPAVLNDWFRYGIVTSPLIYLARMLGGIVPSMGAGFPDPGRENQDGGGSWKGYSGTYTRQTHSLQLGLRNVERNLPSVTCPALVCHGRADRIVDFRNAGIIMGRLGSKDIEAYIANMDEFGHNRHNLLIYESQRDRVWARILDFFESRTQKP
jgi:carboxylesterase